MTRKPIGTFVLGWTKVDLFFDPNTTGGFYSWNSARKQNPEITISTYGKWGEILNKLLHEAQEMAYSQRGLVFGRFGDMSGDTGSRRFFFSHEDFAEATADAARFLVDAIPAIQKAFKAEKRKASK